MKRCKNMEFSKRLKSCFFVTQYKATDDNGNTYLVYAHNFLDLERASNINPATYQKDCGDHFESRDCWTCMRKDGKPIQRPFWYYGRVYTV